MVWSEEQAALLRRIAAGERLNDARPDRENIIEEIESVGRSQVDAVEALLFQALVHWLKAEAWPASGTAPSWHGDSRGFRLQARRRFAPSMHQTLDVADLYNDARKALPETMDGQAPGSVPDTCPFTLDQRSETRFKGEIGGTLKLNEFPSGRDPGRLAKAVLDGYEAPNER